jgi:lipopolysaccharide export system protein LptA
MKRFILALTLFVCFSSFFASITTHAADFRSEDKVTIDTPANNLYASGNKVVIRSNTTRDLAILANEVQVDGEVEGGSIIVGGVIEYQSPSTGGNVRILGSSIHIKNSTIKGDVLVAGSEVIIENTTISGDLVVTSGNFEMKGSKVSGRSIANVGTYTGDKLESQTNGEVIRYEQKVDTSPTTILQNKIWEIGSILLITVVSLYLFRKKHLHIQSIDFGKRFMLDIGLGLLALITPMVAFLLSVFILSPHIFLAIAVATYGIAYLIALLLPVYVGNFIKNVFDSKVPIQYLIALSYIVMVLLSILVMFAPGFAIFYVLIGLLFLAFFGFVLRKSYHILSNHI